MEVDSETASLEELGQILDDLSNKPGQYDLYLKAIELARSLGFKDQLNFVRNLLADRFTLSEALWLDWIQDTITEYEETKTEETLRNVLELYDRALGNFRSSKLAQAKAQFIFSQYFESRGLTLPSEGEQATSHETKPKDEALESLWTNELTFQQLNSVYGSISYHLTESQIIWKLLKDFQWYVCQSAPGDNQTTALRSIYLARLAIPHKEIDDTFGEYSSIITSSFDNEGYEHQMAAANTLYKPSKDKWETREMEEEKLKKSGYGLENYLNYFKWEYEQSKRKGKYRGMDEVKIQREKEVESQLNIALFERAVCDYRDRVELWTEYLDYMLGWAIKEEDDYRSATKHAIYFELAIRAQKAVPWSGLLLSYKLRAAERCGEDEGYEAIFTKAMETGLYDQSVEDLVEVYLTRTDFHRRVFEQITKEEQEPNENTREPVEILREGMKKVRKADSTGDPNLRLEKYAVRLLEKYGPQEEAPEILKKASQMNPSSYFPWLTYAECLIRVDQIDEARAVYERSSNAKLDYPESMIAAWIAFEHQYGLLEDLDETLIKIKRVNQRLALRRQTEYAESQAQQTLPVADVTETTENGGIETEGAVSESGRKRAAQSEASEETAQNARKRTKTDHVPAVELKRDRENCSVLVGNLPKGALETDLERLFSDCGAVREIKFYAEPNDTFATVEFNEREAVLGARTKDKKRVNDCEISVNPTWQSTLFITNFPQSQQDAELRSLFEPYGNILETRWPSKRYQNARRFCYLQFATESAAKASLELHGRELEPKLKLSVLISDPTRKKARTDAQANNREIHISNISHFVKERELRKVFEKYGTIKDLRMETNETGENKGFAFIDFETEDEAQAALSANNYELRKRRIAVTIAQGRHASSGKQSQAESGPGSKKDILSRSVHVSGLPDNVQEAIVQQTFENHGPINKVDLLPGNEATVEVTNAADMGKLLLLPENSIVIDGKNLVLTAELDVKPHAKLKSTSATETTANGTQIAEMVPRNLAPRNVVRGRGRGRAGFSRGGGKGRPGLGAANSVGSSSSAPKFEPAKTADARKGLGQDAFRSMLG